MVMAITIRHIEKRLKLARYWSNRSRTINRVEMIFERS